jgi:hypothetical protein
VLSRESLGISEVTERANRIDPREVSTDDQRLAAQHIENTRRRWPLPSEGNVGVDRAGC